MRRESSTKAPSPFDWVAKDSVRETYRIELITTLIGGGVKSWFTDRKRPFRVGGIKSQLRFWWRSMQVAGTPAELLDREHRLWGGADSSGKDRCASAVRLEISNVRHIGDFREVSGKQVPWPTYVFFPMEKPNNKTPEEVRGGRLLSGTFDLSVTFKSEDVRADWPEVFNALRLWILFGGLGARTRRGCGSLFSSQLMDKIDTPDEVAQLLRSLGSSGTSGSATHYPSIHSARFAASPPSADEPLETWNQLLGAFGDFRQRPGIGRGANYGRSHWPEADSIREELKKWRKHIPQHPSRPWYPRAAYGLPLQFTYGGENKALADGDPLGNHTVFPDGDFERWPSPVILKAIKFPTGKTAKVCLVLNHAQPTGLRLDGNALPSGSLPAAFAGKKTRAGGSYASPAGTEPVDALLEYLTHAQKLRVLIP